MQNFLIASYSYTCITWQKRSTWNSISLSKSEEFHLLLKRPVAVMQAKVWESSHKNTYLKKFKLTFNFKGSPKPIFCTKVSTANYRITANVWEWASEVGVFSNGKKGSVLTSDPSHLLACIGNRTFPIPTFRLINVLQWVRHHFQKSGFVWRRAEASLLTVSQQPFAQAWLLFTNSITKWQSCYFPGKQNQKPA